MIYYFGPEGFSPLGDDDREQDLRLECLRMAERLCSSADPGYVIAFAAKLEKFVIEGAE